LSGNQEQLNIIQDEHRQTVDTLRNQLEAAELEIDRLHTSRIAAANNAAVTVSVSPDPRDITPDRGPDYPRELRVEERQSGEVSIVVVADAVTNYKQLDVL